MTEPDLHGDLVAAINVVLSRHSLTFKRRAEVADEIVDDPGVKRAIAAIAAQVGVARPRRRSCKCAFCPHCRKDHVAGTCSECACKGDFI